MNQLVRLFGITLIMAGTFPAQSSAAQLFRYVNDQGEVVISTQVPREAAPRGYEVLSESGKVLEVVKPELTDEARQALLLKRELEKQQDAVAKVQAEKDAELLRLFNSVEDVDRSLERLLAEIDTRIEVIQGNIQRQQLQFEKKQAQAAGMERSGQKVPDALIQEMKNIQAGKKRFQLDIEAFGKEKDELRAEYAMRKDRVNFLLHGEKKVDQRNENLKLAEKDVSGEWEPVESGADVITWQAEDGGRFLLIRNGDYGIEKWRGNWSLNRDNEIVVVYFRKEFTRAGKTSKVAFAREERYPVMDSRNGDLFVFWDDSVIRFHKAG
ncbi:hypothetical protein [Parendozoicomonas haliclonae]|uniref:DUF4124 domain-containing protein n=1 Tax=Parendozoicomonas haliclonae TaxID=1960125 RepID=A0A1X7AS67_9GAMM|nr:hypothetical protein [Parendozoicomonas haliclonae]SMA50277.1 hypothetical protein EHSB41UT_04071 [Parendozoicomonas haliclonae]